MSIRRSLNPLSASPLWILLFSSLTLALPLAGCSSESSEGHGAPPAAPQQEAQPTADAGGSGDLAPVTTREAAPEGQTISAPGALFTLPGAWQSETPSSSMRLAQAVIPGPDGNGTLTVFYFGPGGGGGVDANLDRWVGQMEVDAGAQPTRETFEVGAFQVTWTEVRGTLKPGTMGGPPNAQPGYTLLGAVVEGAEGPWFFKVTGPTTTLEAQRDAFLGMLKSARTP